MEKTILTVMLMVAVISVPAAFAATSQEAVNQLQNDVNNNRNGMSDSELYRYYERVDELRADTTNNNLLTQLDNIEGILASIGSRVTSEEDTPHTHDDYADVTHSHDDVAEHTHDSLDARVTTNESEISSNNDDITNILNVLGPLPQEIQDAVNDIWTNGINKNAADIFDNADQINDNARDIAQIKGISDGNYIDVRSLETNLGISDSNISTNRGLIDKNIADISTLNSHSHDGIGEHSHADYAQAAHLHASYADASHSHGNYAASSHTHSNYALDSDLNSVRTTANQAVSNVQSLQSTITTLSGNVATISNTLDTVEDNVEFNGEGVSELQEDVEELQEAYKDLNDRIKYLESIIYVP